MVMPFVKNAILYLNARNARMVVSGSDEVLTTRPCPGRP